MASLHKRPDGCYQIRFGKRTKRRDSRKVVNLGKMSDRQADAAQAHIAGILIRQDRGLPADLDTVDWLESLPLELHNRLAAKGLCEYRCNETEHTVQGLCDHYLAWKRDLAADSLRIYRATAAALCHYFGAGREIRRITPADMDDFVQWVYSHGNAETGYKTPLAATTASRRIQNAKAIFRRAARRDWISLSRWYEMFDNVPRQTRTNPDRQYWVEADLVHKVMDHALNNEQRLIFALARWCGLRIPSEILDITWRDVDWEHEKIRIRSPKQSRYAHKRERWVPIWPEVGKFLNQQWDDSPSRRTYVISRYRSRNTSSHSKMFRAACKRMGLIKSLSERPWPKLWTNMRSTRATELRLQYPPAVVDYWLNHSEQVSKTHYQQWTEFEWRI